MPISPGPYLLEECLGRGGMGIVHRAIHRETGQVVALKLTITEAPREQIGLRREIHALSRLDHPGIVRIVDSGVEDGVPWFAMAFLQGNTLADYIRQTQGSLPGTLPTNSTLDPADLDGLPPSPSAAAPPVPAPARPQPLPPLPPAEERQRRLRIARRLLATLAHLHAFGVVHRDIKPDNIFLLDGDQPVLVDFGLSHAGASGNVRETFEDRPLGTGTLGYMAPEVIDGELPDARADLYAAGCVLFELLAGHPPFPLRDASQGQIIYSHRHVAPPSLSDLDADLPAAAVALVAHMLEKDPRQRLGRALDGVDILDRLLPPGDDPYTAPRDSVQLYRPRLAGRQAPLAQLREQLLGLRQRRGGITVVSGPSGIGKTHLVNEAVRSQVTRKVTVIPGRCTPIGPLQRRAGGAPLRPLAELFERLADTCASDAALRSTLLGDRGPLLRRLSPRLGTLVDAQDPAPQVLENDAQRARLIRAVSDTLLAFARHQPVLLLLDDLQWADELTLAVLARLAAQDLSDSALRVVATCRSEERPPALKGLLGQPTLHHIDLEYLPAEDVRALIIDMMGTTAPPAALVASLLPQAGGSPFFVAEYLRTASALSLLHRDPSGSLTLSDGAQDDLPGSLGALVQRRLEVLSPEARQLVHLASVTGRSFDELVVFDASALPVDRLDEATHELLRQQVIEQTPTGALQLAHDKIAELVYAGLRPEVRRDLHRRIAVATAARYDDDLSFHHGELAYHWEQAGDVSAALHHLQAEAEGAWALLAYERVVVAVSRLLELGGGRMADAEQAAWEQMLGESHWSLGDMPRCEHHTLRAFALLGEQLPASPLGWGARIARELGVQALHLLGIGVGTEADPARREILARLSRACHVLCWRYLFADRIPHILALSLAAVNRVEQARPALPSATAYGWLGFNAGSLRLHGLAARYFAQAQADAAAVGSLPDAVFALLMEGLYKASFGQMEEELALSRRALAMLEGKGDPQNEELHRTMVGNISFYKGEFDASIEEFELILSSARGRSNPQHTAWGLYAACWAMTARGEFAAALPRLLEARDLLDQNADLPSEIITHALLALCWLRLGDLDAARTHVFTCADRIQRTKVANYPTPHAFGLAADVALQILDARPQDRALRRLSRRLVRDTGWLTLTLHPYARCVAYRVQGLLLTRLGQKRAAIRRLQKAATASATLGMRYEAALSWWALAVHHRDRVPGAPIEARRRMEDLGCRWHLDQLPP